MIRRRYQRVPGRKTRIIESIVSLTLLPRPVQLTIKSLSPVHHHNKASSPTTTTLSLSLFHSSPPPPLDSSPSPSGHFSFDVERSIIPLIRRVRASIRSVGIFNYLNAEATLRGSRRVHAGACQSQGRTSRWTSVVGFVIERFGRAQCARAPSIGFRICSRLFQPGIRQFLLFRWLLDGEIDARLFYVLNLLRFDGEDLLISLVVRKWYEMKVEFYKFTNFELLICEIV